MALLHKTQKQLLPSILFFQHWMQLWQKKGSLRKRESCRQDKTFFLHQFNHSNKASVEKKKKFLCVTKNIAFNQTTFVWREDFAFNQIIFFLSLEEFYYDFFFIKIIVLKRKAFSHRYATSRWQTSEKEKIFGGEKNWYISKSNKATYFGRLLFCW